MYLILNRLRKYIGYMPHIFNRKMQLHKNLIQGLSVLEEKQSLCYKPLDHLVQRQFVMLKKLLIHASDTVPFYNNRFKDAGFYPNLLNNFDELSQIPLLTKENIRNHTDDLLSRSFKRNSFFRVYTSGSTGSPVQFYIDRNTFFHSRISAILADNDAGRRPGDRFAILWGGRFDVYNVSSILGRIKNLLRNQLILYTPRLDKRILSEYHGILTKYRPHILYGYTSSLVALANWLKIDNLKPDYPMKSIINGAETIMVKERNLIEDVFGVSVFDRYASQDCGPIAMECEAHNGLHLNIIDLLIETSGGTIGKPQELIITNLNGYGMPLIRYKIGDMAVLSNKVCSCGRKTPMIERLAGRLADVIRLPDNSLLPGEFFLQLFQELPIEEFQVVQQKNYTIKIEIVRGEKFREEDEFYINKKIAHHLRGLYVYTKYVKSIKKVASGKRRPVISRIETQYQ